MMQSILIFKIMDERRCINLSLVVFSDLICSELSDTDQITTNFKIVQKHDFADVIDESFMFSRHSNNLFGV